MNINACVRYPQGPLAYLDLISTSAKTVIQTGQLGAILLADILMIYRTFVLWDGNFFVVVLPSLTFAATFSKLVFLCHCSTQIILAASGVAFVHLQHTSAVNRSIFSTSVTQWTVAFLFCSFVTTLYSAGNISIFFNRSSSTLTSTLTAFITYRLWNAQRRLREDGLSLSVGFSRRVTRIIVESAAIYSLNHLLYIILYEIKTNVEAFPSFFVSHASIFPTTF